jgi:hypothetical protein
MAGAGRGRGMTQPAWMTNPAATAVAVDNTSSSTVAATSCADTAHDSAYIAVNIGDSTPTSSASCTTLVALDQQDQQHQHNQTNHQLLEQSHASSGGNLSSYQNYMATQVFSNPVSHNNNNNNSYSLQHQQQYQYQQYQYQQQHQQYQYPQQSSRSATTASSSSCSRMDSLLDAIDDKKSKRAVSEISSSSGQQLEQAGSSSSSSPYDWSKQIDPATSLPYYYNYKTGATQWYVM